MELDVAALVQYVREVRKASRVGREGDAGTGQVRIGADQVRWHRLTVTHAAARLAAGRHADAAFGGLQDSAPRAALLALHARLDHADPSAWEHPALTQVWLRWAVYVVPRADVGVFTLGTQPRDERQRAALDRLGELVVAATPDGQADSRTVVANLPQLPNPLLLKAAAASGRVHVRWDTRTTSVVTAERPSLDLDQARCELARRFLHWLGPASSCQFARWAGVTRADAADTWDAIAPELVPVDFTGRQRWLLATDVDDLVGAERPRGARLLPDGDPCLFPRDDQPTPPEPHEPGGPSGASTRLLNSLTGRIVLDGAVVGAWGRTGVNVVLDPWPSLSRKRVPEVEAEAGSFEGPMGGPIRLRWLPRRP